jgi:quercetin dioxygenase-like cupin family protein
MRALWINADADGKSRVKPLPLPFHRVTEPVDPELFRRQARGEDMRRPRLPPSTGLRAMRILGEQTDPWRTADGRNLVFIVSGRVELTVGDGSTWMLGAGDIYFEEDVSGRGHQVRWVGDCRVLQLGVLASWSPAWEAYFRGFENLFEREPGKWSAVRAVAGFRFVHFPPDSFIDWHPEVVNNFVVV